ncbi:MAG TPA: hypothetical protein VK031_06560 [Tissierellaceae bacterium]|nr:hypothetical protein [Tissierellaceae bacterium]
MADVKTIKGWVNIIYEVRCPHCFVGYSTLFNPDRFAQFTEVEDGEDTEFDARCRECTKDFKVAGFEPA